MSFKLYVTCCVVVLFFFNPSIIIAEEDWYPYPVEIWDNPFDMKSSRTSVEYSPLDVAKKNWNICVSFPHMKDNYWLAVNFGISQEIKRMGSSMRLYQAGGYEKLETQIAQIQQCVDDGADGLIVGAISYDGLNDYVSVLKQKQIPVVDVINGISSNDVSAKSLVSFWEMGHKTGEYLVSLQKKEPNRSYKIVWFPGPDGAGWVQDGNQGFVDALKGTTIEIITTKYGDTGASVQSKLLKDVLDQYQGQIDFIVGTGVTAEVAVRILRKRNLSEKIKVLSYYLTPGVYRKIQRGSILASATDSSVIQGRIAVDQLVRILEGEKYYKHVGPQLNILDQNSIFNFDRKSLLAPNGFKATYRVNRKIIP